MTRVWWNEAPAAAWHDLVACWAASEDGPVEVTSLASARDPDHPILEAADEILPEPPAELGDEAYVIRALEICQQHGVEILVPRARLRAVAAAADRFAAVGTVVLSSPAPAIAIAEDPAAVYRGAADLGIPVPDHYEVITADAFDRAVMAIRSAGNPVCVRPIGRASQSGFRILVDGLPPERLDTGVRPFATAEAVRSAIAAGMTPGPVQVLRYVEGVEWTVDVLAWHGQVSVAIPRRRDPRFGIVVLERAPEAETVAAAIVRGWGLHGVVTVRVMVAGTRPFLIEVHPRAAAGLHWSGHTGVSLTYEAIVAAVHGRPEPALADVVGEVLPMRLVRSGAPVVPED